MPQTILALGALFLAGFVTFSQHRESLHEQGRMVNHEVEAAARGVGMEVMEQLAVLPFDAVTAPADSSALTPEANFGMVSANPLADAGDLDDVHGMADIEIERLYTNPETGTTQALTFLVSADVGYVEQAGSAIDRTGGPQTFAKEVVIAVQHPHLAAPFFFHRVYTF